MDKTVFVCLIPYSQSLIVTVRRKYMHSKYQLNCIDNVLNNFVE